MHIEKIWILLEGRPLQEYNLSNYQSIPNFTTDTGRRKIGKVMKLKNIPGVAFPKLKSKYPEGTKVNVLGRVINNSTQHYILINPVGTDEVYKCYSYYLTNLDEEITYTPRIAKRLSGEIECLRCHKPFSLEMVEGRHRNHCPHCLGSVHIDIRLGDRAAWCGEGEVGNQDNWIPSIIDPVGQTINNGLPSIVGVCRKCKAIKINKVAVDDTKEVLDNLPNVFVKKKNGKNVDIEEV